MPDWFEMVAMLGGPLVLLATLLLLRFRPGWLQRSTVVSDERLAEVLDALGEPGRVEIKRLVSAGRRIEAIRRVRTRSRASLIEARAAVDHVGDVEPRSEDPSNPVAPA